MLFIKGLKDMFFFPIVMLRVLYSEIDSQQKP